MATFFLCVTQVADRNFSSDPIHGDTPRSKSDLIIINGQSRHVILARLFKMGKSRSPHSLWRSFVVAWYIAARDQEADFPVVCLVDSLPSLRYAWLSVGLGAATEA